MRYASRVNEFEFGVTALTDRGAGEEDGVADREAGHIWAKLDIGLVPPLHSTETLTREKFSKFMFGNMPCNSNRLHWLERQ